MTSIEGEMGELLSDTEMNNNDNRKALHQRKEVAMSISTDYQPETLQTANDKQAIGQIRHPQESEVQLNNRDADTRNECV